MKAFFQRYEQPETRRYYWLILEPDLLEGYHVDRIWGGIGEANTHHKTEWFDRYEDAYRYFQKEDHRRIHQRHYQPVARV